MRREKENLETVEYATLEWVNCFNNVRSFELIGSIPPAELEKAYYTDLHYLPVIPWLIDTTRKQAPFSFTELSAEPLLVDKYTCAVVNAITPYNPDEQFKTIDKPYYLIVGEKR